MRSYRLSRRVVLWGLGCLGALSLYLTLHCSVLPLSEAEPQQVRDLAVGTTNRETPVVHPVTLRVVYHDEKIHPGESGDVIREGAATYTFKNTLPIAVKLAFPPIGYVPGSTVPVTPQCIDIKEMPTFCQNAQVATMKPFAELRFRSRYNIMTAATRPRAPVERFMFGSPVGSQEKNIVVDSVESVGAFEEPK